MPRICCIAGIDEAVTPVLTAVLEAAGETTRPLVAALDVRALGKLRPDLLIADIDRLTVDPLELVRQIRFVLPSCAIALYTGDGRQAWTLACHMAGANGLLSKSSSEEELANGIRDVLASGCYTDPRFVA
jgi:two-component system response regulator DesR